MNLEFNGERLTINIDNTAGKMQDSESIQLVETVKPPEQKNPEKEPITFPSESAEGENLKRETADWFNETMTGEMNDEALEKAIMDFCKLTRPVKTEEGTQPGRAEKSLGQGVPLGKKLKGSTSPTRQLLSLPESPDTLWDLPGPRNKETTISNGQGQGGQLAKGLRQGEERIQLKRADLMEIKPNQYIHPAMVEKGAIDPYSRQKKLPSRCLIELMPGEQDPKWADPHITTATHPPEANMHKGDPPNSFSFRIKGGRVDPYRDKTETGMVEEIPLTLPHLIQ